MLFRSEIRAATNLTSNIIATLVVGRWAGAVDMATASAELQAGFVETDETRAWEARDEPVSGAKG